MTRPEEQTAIDAYITKHGVTRLPTYRGQDHLVEQLLRERGDKHTSIERHWTRRRKLSQPA